MTEHLYSTSMSIRKDKDGVVDLITLNGHVVAASEEEAVGKLMVWKQKQPQWDEYNIASCAAGQISRAVLEYVLAGYKAEEGAEA